jgi:hypothetical protein
LSAQFKLRFSIDLGQPKSRLQGTGGLCKLGCHRFAWTTPGHPEIHQYGNIIPLEVPGKVTAVQLHRMTTEKRLATIPAHGMFCQFGGRKPIDGVA